MPIGFTNPTQTAAPLLRVAGQAASLTKAAVVTVATVVPAGMSLLSSHSMKAVKDVINVLSSAIKSAGQGMVKVANQMADGAIHSPVKTAVNVVGWGAAIGERVENTLTALQVGGEVGAKALETVAHVLGTALGITSMVAGTRDIVSSFRASNRADGLQTRQKDIESLKSDPNTSADDKVKLDQLKQDLKFSEDSNRLRSKDLAISGCVDLAAGACALTASALTSGAATPFSGLIAWGSGQAIKNGLRMYRGAQQTPAMETQRHDVQTRLMGHVEALKNKGPNDPLTPVDRAVLMSLKTVGLISDDSSTSKLTPKMVSQLYKIDDKGIESKFTKNTETLSTSNGIMENLLTATS